MKKQILQDHIKLNVLWSIREFQMQETLTSNMRQHQPTIDVAQRYFPFWISSFKTSRACP